MNFSRTHPKIHDVLAGLLNGRLKDYYDIWMISEIVPFQRAELAQAIARTLDRRKTERPTDIPVALTDEFTDRADKQDLWKGFLNRTVPERSELKLAKVAGELRGFLGPVIQTLATPETATGEWRPGIGWQL